MKSNESFSLQDKLVLQLHYLRRFGLIAALLFFFLMIVLGSLPGRAEALSSLTHDKLLHFAAYSVISLLLYAGMEGSRLKRAMKTLLSVALLGLLDETIQHFLHYRNSDVRDWLFNMLAAVLNVTLYTVLPSFMGTRPVNRRARRSGQASPGRTN